MILSSKMIKEQLESGNWTTNVDFETLNFGPNSVDVTLSDILYTYKNSADHDHLPKTPDFSGFEII
jgi:deoxycytidine triphosphate deaminase